MERARRESAVIREGTRRSAQRCGEVLWPSSDAAALPSKPSTCATVDVHGSSRSPQKRSHRTCGEFRRRRPPLVESEPSETGAGRTKSGRWREVPLNRYAKWALRHLPDPPVSVHQDTISDWFKVDSERAGVGGHLHRLRHTFCAHIVQAGVSLRGVQLLAGHSNYSTTEKYHANLYPDGDESAISTLKF
ncbi:tyrosine-type recombinase/integrase [Stenotrophomonas rhizophila]